MNTLFHIEQEVKDDGEPVLLCEWGEDFCIIAYYYEQSRNLQSLDYFSFECLNEALIENILKKIQDRHNTSKQIISSAFPQAMLLPKIFYKEKHNVLSQLYGSEFKNEINDFIGEWQIYNIYAFPDYLYMQLKKALPDCSFLHAYTSTLNVYNGFAGANQLMVHFTPKHFRVVVKKEVQLLLAQIYFYNSPLDVVYYLLKIFQELGLSKEETQIILSGLVEEDSALYKELYHYFFNVHFDTSVSISLPKLDYPQHFFTSIYKLAACV